MPGRRRQKRTEASKIDATPPWEQRTRQEPELTTGPFDERDAPADDVERIDLGALQVPVGADFDIRVDLDESQQVVAVTFATPDGTMQLGVFAAPRNEGIWEEVRAEIAASLNSQKGSNSNSQHPPTAEDDGPFGTELRGRIPDPNGRGTVPVRFIGVDGPRWFLRAMLAGPVAADPAKAERFEASLRQIVVVRGSDPLPVREPVPLRLPEGLDPQSG